jgi:Mannose-6-phosphate isomerase
MTPRKYKVKEVVVIPEKGMSFQNHYKENEIWLFLKGIMRNYYFYKMTQKIKSK